MTLEYESPFVICPAFNEEHLELLASEMLDVVETTLATNSGRYDDNYTFETTLFGRTRQLFIALNADKGKPWLSLPSKAMDYVPKICGIPVRVFKDDPFNPKKIKIFHQNWCEQQQLDLLFSEEFTSKSAITWRLLIEPPAIAGRNESDEILDLEDDYHVVLVGYRNKNIVSMWRSTSVMNTPVSSIDDVLTPERPVERKIPVLKPIDADETAEEDNE